MDVLIPIIIGGIAGAVFTRIGWGYTYIGRRLDRIADRMDRNRLLP